MKKSLPVVLSVALVSSMFASMAFAADATTDTSASTSATATAQMDTQGKYDALKALGIFEGDENGANLDGNMTRAQLAKILTLLKGLNEDTASADVYGDLDGAGWAKGYIGAVTKAGLMDGTWDGQFSPSGEVSTEQLATVLVRFLGLQEATDPVEGTVSDWAQGYVSAAVKNGLIPATDDFTVSAKRSAFVDATYAAKQAADKQAEEEAAKQAAALDISSAAAINSKVVEVVLNTAAKAADLIASNVTVKDAAGNAVAVSDVKAAGYATDGKTVLVTLGADTTAGTLYTLTSGTKSANFGGRAADTTKPTISSISATDANEVTITFSEPVALDGAVIKLAEKYGTKAAVEVKSMAYNGSSKIVVKTGDMKDATLYNAEVSAVADFAGNAMDADTDNAFSGKAASTDAAKVTGAASNNADEVLVQFNLNVDPATLTAANFKVEEAYGSKTVMNVSDVRLATTDDQNLLNNATVGDPGYKMYAVLSVKDLKNATLYKVTATGIKTAYGKDIDTTANTATFSGKARPTDAFTYSITGSKATSNTTINVVYPNKVDKAEVENVANYAITEAYGNKAAVTVSKAELQSDGKTVKLTVSALSQVLYKMTVSNVHDIYGNAVKTDSSANVVSFSGVGVATKIAAINSIAYDAGSDTVVIVTFDQNVGANATDVSLYSIDNSVGYPAKVEKGDADNKVKLTIPKLTKNTTYTLTVKGLLNADGVAMDTAGVSATFAGKGVDAGLPQLQAAIATDNQTLKIYFDRDVTDSTIAGPIWNKDTNVLAAGALTVVAKNAVTTGVTTYAYQDSTDKNVLVIRTATDNAFVSDNKNTTDNAFRLNGSAAFNADYKTLLFAPNESEPAKITVDNVLALNSTTLRVYFNQPVFGTLADNTAAGSFATVNDKNDGSGTQLTLNNANPVDSTKTVYDFKLSGALANNGTFYLIANTAAAATVIGDAANSGTDIVGLADEDSVAGGNQQVRAFAGNTTVAADIKDVSVLMTDEKTIKVYFPTLMDSSITGTGGGASVSATDFDNYDIVGNDGTTKVVMSNDANFNAATDIATASYDTTDNSVTLTLNKTIKTASTGAFLSINKAVKNAVGTAAVQDGTNTISKQFATSATASAKVTVASATYANDTLTIKLNQKAKSAANINGSAATLLANYGITVKQAAGAAGTAVVAGNIASVATKDGTTAVADSSTTFFDTIEVTFQGLNIASGEVGKVEANVTTQTGINGNASDADSSAIFVQQ